MPSDRFELVATLGPASFHLARQLVEAGATSLRLNTSHGEPAGTRACALRARAEAPDVPLVLDLQGAKMRLGRILERPVRAGEVVRFTGDAEKSDALHVPHPELFDQVERGDTLSLDDDRIRLVVVERHEGDLVARSAGAGTIRARKGINVLDHPVHLADLTAADQAFCSLAAEVGASVALSFMADGSEAEWVARRAAGVAVAGKVERKEAVGNLARIARAVGSVWICRGDLGAQIGASALAHFVASLRPREQPTPFLMAGQVLEHLTEHGSPTRSEVCHLFDLIDRGYAGIVLSDETAIGLDPIRAVREAAALAAALAG